MRRLKAEDSIGMTYGELTVLRFVGEHVTPNGRKFKKVECMCSCGNLAIANLQDIRSKKTKTCGLNHPHYKDRTIPAFNQLYRHTYRKRALDRGLDFDLTEDEFRILTQQNCHYCGTSPTSNMITTKSGKINSTYTYNGIDRTDNKKGYINGNVVPCCCVCNHAKHTLSYIEFLNWVSRVYKHSAHPRGSTSLVG